MAIKGFDSDYYVNSLFAYLQEEFSEWADKTVDDAKALIQNEQPADDFDTSAELYYMANLDNGLAPNEFFNAAEYRLAWAKVQVQENMATSEAAALLAYDAAIGDTNDHYAHYQAYGAAMGVNPSNLFDESDYLQNIITTLAWDGVTVDALRDFIIENGYTPLDLYITYPESHETLPAFPVEGDELVTVTDTSVVTLTSGVDIESANIFEAPRVWDPEGDDQRNSLDDDDVLTGVGVNPTLNLTYISSVDGQADDLAPTLNNIQTINVKFDGDAQQTLDLQDATGLDSFNILRVDADVVIDNITNVPTNFSVKNSSQVGDNLSIMFTDGAVKGSADETTLTLDNVNVNNFFFEETHVVTTPQSQTVNNGLETINLVLEGDAVIDGTFEVADLTTLNITGDGNLRVDAFDSSNTGGNGTFTTINAAEATGDLTLNLSNEVGANLEGTSGVNIDFTYTGGSGSDTIIVGEDDIDSTDTIDGGEGANTIVIDGNATDGDVIYKSAVISNIQTLEMDIDTSNDADVTLTVNTSLVGGLEKIVLQHDAANATSPDDVATWNLKSLADGVTAEIRHSDTGANTIAENVVNVEKAAGATGAFEISITDGVNTDPRFNFTLDVDGDNTDGDKITDDGFVASVTINDQDSESNTIALVKTAEHTGTITLTGGEAGDFMNLDATANALGYDQSGAAIDASGTTEPGGNAAERIVAATFDASEYLGNVVARFSSNYGSTTGAQAITTGSGNDTVIFDLVDTDLNTAGLQADSRAGLTISDTVAGGEGNDTLGIDGNGVNIKLGASEWTNVSGFENIKLMGNSAGNDYTLILSNQLIDDNAADGDLINIINDNDSRNDTENIADNLNYAAESSVTIDAMALNDQNSFSYNGEEGLTQTADRFIFSDVNINGKAVIDGGAVNNDVTKVSVANNDVIEVRNQAVVSTGDLANIKNVGTIEFTNDQAQAQVSTIELNDSVVDAMVDSYEASSATNVETLKIVAIDNPTLYNATVGLTVEASSLTSKSALDIDLAGGKNTVTTGAGDDRVQLDFSHAGDGIIDTITLGAGNDTVDIFGYNSLINDQRIYSGDVLQLQSGDNIVNAYGGVNISNLNISADNGTITYNYYSNITMTEQQFRDAKEINFEGSDNHTLTIISDGVPSDIIDLSKIDLNGTGGLDIIAVGLSNGTSRVSVDENNPNVPTFNGTTPITAVDDLDAFTVSRNGSVTLYAADLLDSPLEDGMTIVAIDQINTDDGIVSLDIAAQTLTFNAADTVGTASFRYTISDGTSTAIGLVTGTIIENSAPVIDTDIQDLNVAEDSAAGTVIATTHASDPDGNDLYYTLYVDGAQSDDTIFSIDGDGVVTLTGALDYESVTSYNLEVAINDGYLTTFDGFTVNVDDINEAPTAIDIENQVAIDENAAGAIVGQLSVTDPDAGDTLDTFTFTVDNSDFEVDATGQLKLVDGVSLDFEALTNGSLDVIVTAEDADGLSVDQTFTVTVNDLVESEPVSAGNTASDPFDADSGDITFAIAAGSSNYTYNIMNFKSNDVLDFPDGVQPTVSNLDYTDDAVDVVWASGVTTVTIHLTGLPTGTDSQLNFIGDFATVFGGAPII